MTPDQKKSEKSENVEMFGSFNQTFTQYQQIEVGAEQKREIIILSEYEQFFQDVNKVVESNIYDFMEKSQKLKQYRIEIIEKTSWNEKMISHEEVFIDITDFGRNGELITYTVIIGKLKLTIKMVNLGIKSLKQLSKVGEGAFGNVLLANMNNGQKIIIKRMMFKRKCILLPKSKEHSQWSIKPNRGQIENAICEYAITKIASFFQIGPQILLNQFNFDLACYDDSIQFYMQPCITDCFQFENLVDCNFNDFSLRIKYCIRLLHWIGIIHKDIKPQNIMFSNTLNEYVISDFGVSHPIGEKPGQLSESYREGTYHYMSNEMIQIPKGQTRKIDLYYNDMYALKLTISELSGGKKNIKKKKSKTINTEFKDIAFYNSLNIFSEIISGTKIAARQAQLISTVQIFYEKVSKEPTAETLRQNIELFFRVIGACEELNQILSNVKNDPKIELLKQRIEKISRRRNRQVFEQLALMHKQERLKILLSKEVDALETKQTITQTQQSELKKLLLVLFDQQISMEKEVQGQMCQMLIEKMQMRNKDESWLKQIEIRKIQLKILKKSQYEINQIEKILNKFDLSQIDQILSQLAMVYIIAEDRHKALQCCIRIKKKNARIIIIASHCFQEFESLERCFFYFREILQMQEYRQMSNLKIHLYYTLAICQKKRKRKQQATKYFSLALDGSQLVYGVCHKKTANLRKHKAQSHFDQDHYHSAIEECKKYLTSNLLAFGQTYKTLAPFYNLIGRSYMHLGEFQEALKAFQTQRQILIPFKRFKSVMAELVTNLMNCGHCQLQLFHYQKAIKLYLQAQKDVGQSPEKSTEMLLYVAHAYLKMGDRSKAANFYQQCLSRSSLSPESKSNNIYEIHQIQSLTGLLKCVQQCQKYPLYKQLRKCILRWKVPDLEYRSKVMLNIAQYMLKSCKYNEAIYCLKKFPQVSKNIQTAILKCYGHCNKLKYIKILIKEAKKHLHKRSIMLQIAKYYQKKSINKAYWIYNRSNTKSNNSVMQQMQQLKKQKQINFIKLQLAI